MNTKLKIHNQTVYFKSSEKMSEVPDGSVNLIVTSPPYWMIKQTRHPEAIGQEPYEQYIERLNNVWNECYRVTANNGILVINVRSKRHKGTYHPIAMDICNKMQKWKLIEHIIWYIPNALPQPNHYLNKLFDEKYEDVLVFAKNYDYTHTFNKIHVPQIYRKIDPRKDKMNRHGKSIGNVIKIPAYRPPNIKKMNYHEAAFPEELVQVFVFSFTKKEDTVLDPFLGSGTTLKVTRHMHRQGIGYEIDKSYRDLIKNRIQEEWNPPSFKKMDPLVPILRKGTPLTEA